jgi:hypothetical protein
MKKPQYAALELIERLQEEHAKLGNHPSVQIVFSTSVEEVSARVPTGSPPSILVPIPDWSY